MKKLDYTLTSCEAGMPLRSTPYLWRYRRRRPQIGAYSVISEKGHKNGRISPAQLLFKSQNALTEVCAKEERNLMKQMWSTGSQPLQRMHIENASLKSLLGAVLSAYLLSKY